VKRIALLTLMLFGCSTVRIAALPEGEVVDAPGTVAPPVVELWLESPDPVARAESDRAAQAAETAINQAVSELQVSPSALGAQDAVLFVRERGVALTDAREHQQTLAKIGIVAVVAAVIIGVVAGSSHGGGGGGRHFTRAATPRATGAGAVAVRPIARPVVPIGARPVAPIVRGPRYYPGYGPPVFIGVSFYVPVHPLIYQADPDEDPFPADVAIPLAPPGPELAMNDEPPGPPDGPPPPEAMAPLELPRLAPPADFDVQERGFFEGSHIGLQLDLMDRATGQLLWSKPVASDGNPCSASDVTQLLRSALAGQGWARPAERAGR
jgi:hypothetical protein